MDQTQKKLDRIEDRLNSIDQHLAVYNEQLAYHIKRTELLEKQVAPIKQHVDELRGVGKFLAFISIIASIVGVVYSLME